ncbi:hypothetical protein EJ06DRAFT_253700 [Trichodelitschia bisporula]|uniref:Uncharacterized protein n=1 Tax=Trichodelitschia bisporula TaxID=703511 RepID=A0A6G1HJR8_9PEZI|nr:hypothetical protein EJ06DRAFT_253700 [Trichodelitschia bisporula]
MELVTRMPEWDQKRYSLWSDNLFTTEKLIDILGNSDVGATGTARRRATRRAARRAARNQVTPTTRRLSPGSIVRSIRRRHWELLVLVATGPSALLVEASFDYLQKQYRKTSLSPRIVTTTVRLLPAFQDIIDEVAQSVQSSVLATSASQMSTTRWSQEYAHRDGCLAMVNARLLNAHQRGESSWSKYDLSYRLLTPEDTANEFRAILLSPDGYGVPRRMGIEVWR